MSIRLVHEGSAQSRSAQDFRLNIELSGQQCNTRNSVQSSNVDWINLLHFVYVSAIFIVKFELFWKWRVFWLTDLIELSAQIPYINRKLTFWFFFRQKTEALQKLFGKINNKHQNCVFRKNAEVLIFNFNIALSSDWWNIIAQLFYWKFNIVHHFILFK